MSSNKHKKLNSKWLIIKTTAALCAMLLFTLCVAGCSNNAKLTRDGFYFDTYVSITIYSTDRDAGALLDRAIEQCAFYDRLLSKTDPNSDICRINSANGQAVTINEQTAEIIALGLEYSELSGGVFDITCGRVTALWVFDSEQPALPDPAELSAAVETVDHTAVHLEETSVTLPAGCYLDLGGIAKGFIADRLADMLADGGVKSAIIDLGGNIYTVGDKGGKPFRVGVQSPFRPDRYACTLDASDVSIVTAGTYERGFTLDGVYYHHIIDLKTGMPSNSPLASVTVISKESVQGDALSTICFLLGEEKGVELIEGLDGVEAIFIRTDGDQVHTAGADKYIH